MTFLVTGAAGFIGYHLAKALSADGTQHVVCVDNGVRGEFDILYQTLCQQKNVTRIDGDLNDRATVSALPDDVDVIFHMAALNGTQNFYDRPFEVVRCCTLPTIFLLEKYGPLGRLVRFVYAGTSESYASTVTQFGWPVPTGEDVPLSISDVFNPRWSYAASKTHGEVATVSGCRQYGVPFTIVRFHNAYGPRMGDKHVVPDFYIRARLGVYALYGYDDTRSFIYVDDAVRATLAVAAAAEADGQVINIGSEHEIKIADLGERMMAAAGLSGTITLHSSPTGSVKRRCPDLGKLRQLTGFAEAWSLEDGLRATARFYVGHP